MATTNRGEPERKKRVAERQITKDDPDSEDEKDNVRGGGGGDSTFQKADDATLRSRRIVRVKRDYQPPMPSSSSEPEKPKDEKKKKEKEEDGAKGNAFAKIFVAPTTSSGSVFGSGYSSGFGTAAAIKADNGGKSPGFGFGLGSSSNGDGFGSTQSTGNSSTASIFGSSSAFSSGGRLATVSSTVSSSFGETASSSTARSEQQVTSFPEHVELRTGEEDEDVIFTVRAKSQMLADKEEVKQEETTSEAPSVPPSSSTTTPSMADAKDTAEETDKKQATMASPKAVHVEPTDPKASKEDDHVKTVETVGADVESAKKDATSDPKPKQKEWRELGIGPLKILKNDKNHTRLVQRRETAPGGAGTKLIVNAVLSSESKVARASDQQIRFTTIEPSGKAAIYLLKVKTKVEADQLQKVLEDEIVRAPSFAVDGN